MVHRFLSKSIVVLIAGIWTAGGCGETPAKDPALTGARQGEQPGPDDNASGRSTASSKRRGSGFGQSINKVYGIKIPTGMTPAKGPARVVRFRGKHPLSQVVYLIRKEARFEKEIRENDGYLFRFATAKGDAVKRQLAIRIGRDGDDTTLDIWKERAYRDSLPNETAIQREEAEAKTPTRVRFDGEVQARRHEKMAEAVRIFRKMGRHEPLTEAERESNLFN
jgi:hypothetical protein